jgi:tail assembly chaperone
MELRKTQSQDIDGQTYEVTALGAIRGSQVLVRLLKVVGPALAGDLPSFFAGLREEDMTYLCNSFSPMTNVVGVGPLDKVFDMHFSGRYATMLKWLQLSLQVNYGDFSFLKGAGLGVPGAGQATASSSPKAQTTGSGAS